MAIVCSACTILLVISCPLTELSVTRETERKLRGGYHNGQRVLVGKLDISKRADLQGQ